MKATTSIKIAGGFTTFFFIFHIPFYWMLDWKHTLACLNTDNWAIFQCFNIISIVLLMVLSYISLFHTQEMHESKIGKTLLIFASWFYCFRIAAEFIFFVPNPVMSPVIIVLCAIPAVFFALPLIKNRI